MMWTCSSAFSVRFAVTLFNAVECHSTLISGAQWQRSCRIFLWCWSLQNGKVERKTRKIKPWPRRSVLTGISFSQLLLVIAHNQKLLVLMRNMGTIPMITESSYLPLVLISFPQALRRKINLWIVRRLVSSNIYFNQLLLVLSEDLKLPVLR